MAKAPSPPAKQAKKPEKKLVSFKRTPWFIACFALLIALVALGINWKLTQAVNKTTLAFDATLSMLTEQQSRNAARLEALHARVTEEKTMWQTQVNALEHTLQTTLKNYTNRADDWRLLKARHLLELAALNAHWSSNKDAVVAMLREADALLAPMHNTKLLSVRQHLAQDITEQLSLATTDITALLVRLDAIQAKTWALDIHPLPLETSSNQTTVDTAPTEHPTRMAAAVNFLKTLVVIRHNPSTIEPKPTLAFEAILRATVRLSLQEAQWAVLEHNNTVYHLALNQAISNLERTFSSTSTRTQALLGQLKQLNETQLRTEQNIPDQGLNALNQVISASPKINIKPQKCGFGLKNTPSPEGTNAS